MNRALIVVSLAIGGLALGLFVAVRTGMFERPAPLAVSRPAAELDQRIDWSAARLIAVQDSNRYKTLDSFAREMISGMYGREHLPGLSPLASLLDWLFRSDAYADQPVVRIRDVGLRIEFSTHMERDVRERLRRTGYMTPREFADPMVDARIRELDPKAHLRAAMNRVHGAQATAFFLERVLKLVPATSPTPVDPWFTIADLRANLPDEALAQRGLSRERVTAELGPPIPGMDSATALKLTSAWDGLRTAWLASDAPGVQARLDELATALPAVAQPGVYPARSQLAAEARYHAMGKLTLGWIVYFVGALFSVLALVTWWRWAWGVALSFLLLALGLHLYGVALRWYIVDRIPVANMFEAIVSSAWIGAALGCVCEVFYRKRVFLLAASLTGFLALVIGGYVLPGGGTINSIMGILDDVMLRIHTVAIIASYALIFLASVIAAIYLFGFYFVQHPEASAIGGLVFSGACTLLFGALRALPLVTGIGADGGPMELARQLSGGGAVIGLLWAVATLVGLWAGYRPVALLAGGPAARLNPVTLSDIAALRLERPILAGGAPGDEHMGRKLPHWLHQFDWCHLIILNIVFWLLFAGVILGAVWADYSWGRPWGWDPKEVFAMNTWLIYAILIHIRFVVKEKGVWTAWLSVAGCLMMAFNWCVVNFFIVGLHSYA